VAIAVTIEHGTIPIIVALFLSGCAGPGHIPVDPAFWRSVDMRVGVALASSPEPEVFINAADTSTGFGGSMIHSGPGLEYHEHPMRLHETRTLRNASREFQAQGFDKIRALFVQGLTERGFRAFPVEQAIDMKSLGRFKGQGNEGEHACRDFRDLGRSVHADHLIVVSLERCGTTCRYMDLENYQVEVFAQVGAEMVETATNRLVWRTGYRDGPYTALVDASCARPDHVPLILEALDVLLGDAAAKVTADFFSSAPVSGHPDQPGRR
jgi:hypothetical protein